MRLFFMVFFDPGWGLGTGRAAAHRLSTATIMAVHRICDLRRIVAGGEPAS